MMVMSIIIAVGTVGCAKDDGNPSPPLRYEDAIKGEWVELEKTYLDKDRKEVSVLKLNNGDCPPRIMEFREDLVIETISMKSNPSQECKDYRYKGKYTIEENFLKILYSDLDILFHEAYEITELTSDRLVYLEEDYFLDNTLLGYIQTVLVRK